MRILLMVLVCALGLQSQTRRPSRKVPDSTHAPKVSAPSSWPVSRLSVSGNKLYPEAAILEVAGLKIGDRAGKAEFEAARDRLVETGLFDSVGYRFEPAQGTSSYTASFQVIEVDQLYPFRFESLPLDAAEAKQVLKQRFPLLSDRIPGTKNLVERMRGAVQEILKDKGHSIEVAGRLSAVAAGKLEIVFQPVNLPSVAEVNFTGNSLVPLEELQRAVAGPGVGAIYTEDKMRQILDLAIRPIYEAKGRLRVSFPKLEVMPAKSVNGLVVTVTLEEGPEFRLREVKLADPFQEDKALLKEGKFDTGEVANFGKVREAVERMEASLRRRGYIETKSKVERKIDDTAKALDLIVDIDPGPQFTFGKLNVEGLDIQSEPEIRKLWALKKGAPFNSEYPEFFLNRIREDGVFDNLGSTKSIVTPDPGRFQVDVTLVFKGAPPKPPKAP